jgi:putative addiction module CopG family antidote
MTIILPPELERFVAHQVARGSYQSPVDVVRAGLELLREQQDDDYRAEDLRREIHVGIAEAGRGELQPFDPVGSLTEVRRRKARGLSD